MEKTKLSKLFDFIFQAFVVFIISLIWIRFYMHNILLIYIFSSLITVAVCYIFYRLRKRKQKKLNMSEKEASAIKNSTKTFMFQSKQQTLKDFASCFEKKNIKIVKKSDYLLFGGTLIRPIYFSNLVDDSVILETCQKSKTAGQKVAKIIICGREFSSDAKLVAKEIPNFKIFLFNEQAVWFKILKPAEFVPKQFTKAKEKISVKSKLGGMFNIAFNKKRFKGYMFSALLLLIGSYFMRYNIYYLTISSLLLCFAFFSYFNKPFNRMPNEDIFEPQMAEL